MKLTDYARLSVLLSRLARYSPGRPAHPRVVEELDLSADGAPFDLYRPRQAAPRQTLVAVHGASRPGGRDPRIVHFARCLARSGVACAVPHLEGVACCRWEPRDVDQLAAVVGAVAAQADAQIGMLGFSYGGSYSLVVAARPELAARVRFVVSIGAFYSLSELFEWYLCRRGIEPSSEKEWDFEIYLRLVLAHQHRERLALAPSLWPEMESLLWRYCEESSPSEKRAFYDTHLRELDATELAWRDCDPVTLAALSPAGKLGEISAFVGIVHDRDDVVIPSQQGERIFQELSERPDAERHQLVVTSLVSHVSPTHLFRVGELKRFSSVLSPILDTV